MRIKEVRFSKKIQVEQFEPEEVTLVAEVDNGEDHQAVLQYLNKEACLALGLKQEKVTHVTETKEESPEVESKAPAKQAKKAKVSKAAPAKNSPAKPKPTPKPKTVKYDRAVEAHRDEFANVLNSKTECTGWQEENKKSGKAKALSESLQGAELMDDKGNVLPSFVTLVVEGYTASNDL